MAKDFEKIREYLESRGERAVKQAQAAFRRAAKRGAEDPADIALLQFFRDFGPFAREFRRSGTNQPGLKLLGRRGVDLFLDRLAADFRFLRLEAIEQLDFTRDATGWMETRVRTVVEYVCRELGEDLGAEEPEEEQDDEAEAPGAEDDGDADAGAAAETDEETEEEPREEREPADADDEGAEKEKPAAPSRTLL